MTRCQHCGANYCRSESGGYKYCSSVCQKQAKWLARKRVEGMCGHCGSSYITTLSKGQARSKYCSRVCANKAKWQDRDYPTGVAQQRWLARPDNVLVSLQSSIRKHYRAHLKAGYRLKPCINCSKPFAGPRAKYCSDRCGVAAHSSGVLTNHTACPTCGVEWCRVKKGCLESYCSDACRDAGNRKAKAKHRRIRRSRARSKNGGERIDPLEVFERDGWQCRGCGCETPPELRGTYHDDAPEMDHIHPLAKGGTHTTGNVQTLCRLCNQLKHDMEWHEFGRIYLGRPTGPAWSGAPTHGEARHHAGRAGGMSKPQPSQRKPLAKFF
jgi:hypothetical protein